MTGLGAFKLDGKTRTENPPRSAQIPPAAAHIYEELMPDFLALRLGPHQCHEQAAIQ
jgi:hypothetical protein